VVGAILRRDLTPGPVGGSRQSSIHDQGVSAATTNRPAIASARLDGPPGGRRIPCSPRCGWRRPARRRRTRLDRQWEWRKPPASSSTPEPATGSCLDHHPGQCRRQGQRRRAVHHPRPGPGRDFTHSSSPRVPRSACTTLSFRLDPPGRQQPSSGRSSSVACPTRTVAPQQRPKERMMFLNDPRTIGLENNGQECHIPQPRRERPSHVRLGHRPHRHVTGTATSEARGAGRCRFRPGRRRCRWL